MPAEKTSSQVFHLDQPGLTLDDLRDFLAGRWQSLELSPWVLEATARARRVIEDAADGQEAVYGVNTGFGKLSRVRIEKAELAELQRNLILSHSVGTGPDLPPSEARLALLLRINALSRGYSGLSVALLERLVALLNSGIVPAIPEQGSVGASGDLAPLAHMSLLLLGMGFALKDGQRVPGAQALADAGIEPLVLGPKEGLALINGTQISTAISARAWLRAHDLVRIADLGTAMSLEAEKGSSKPFDTRVQDLRRIPHSHAVAANVRALLEGSQILPSHAGCDRVQDQYSLRCVPQVHGSARHALAFAEQMLENELNAVTDNPLVFPDQGDVVSAGNFHAQPISLAADVMSLGLTDLASISERRIESLVNPDLSKLPAFLAPEPGLHSGYMMAQVTAASLVSESKCLAHPASVDSIPTSANKEDHVSMGPIAARQARAIVDNLEGVLAIELLCACQALDFETHLKPGRGVEAARECLRSKVPFMDKDRLIGDDIEMVRTMIRDGELLASVRDAGISMQ